MDYGLNDIVEMKKEHPCHKSKEWKIIRMGADIRVEGKLAIIDGVNSLIGAHVKATDLRAGAAMIIAGLMAEGTTEITDIYHIDRGYENFEEKFVNLGGSIERVQVVDDLLD